MKKTALQNNMTPTTSLGVVKKSKTVKTVGDSPLLNAMIESTVSKPTVAARPKKSKSITPDTTTTNGALAHSTTYSKCLDFFVAAGNSRGQDINEHFINALKEDQDVSLRTLQYLRDVRGGLGERDQFKKLIRIALSEKSIPINVVISLIGKIVEIGRFDDLIEVFHHLSLNKGKLTQSRHSVLLDTCLLNVKHHLFVVPNKLAFKWCPTKGPVAKFLYKKLGFKTEQQWRKFVVPNRTTVEQSMCAKQWDEIEFGKLPSVASARYQKAFTRNGGSRYKEYIEQLKNGTAKINASALYPYDVIKALNHGNSEVSNAQWKALPDLIHDKTMNILPLIDVSSSMNCPTAVKGFSAMDMAIALGLYICEHARGKFKDSFLTFSDRPQLVLLPPKASLQERLQLVRRAHWEGSTNILRAFETVLNVAVTGGVKAKDMPSHIIVLSDMQFNSHNVQGRDLTTFQYIDKMYKEAGYKRPQLIFWKLDGDVNSANPITIHDSGTAMVSGFSTNVLSTVLGKKVTPIQAMLETVMIDRYSLW